MKIQNIQSNSFKGVYRVEEDEQSKSFKNNESKTKKLYNLLIGSEQKDVVLFKKGQLKGLVDLSSPELILTNDELGNDAEKYLKLKYELNNKTENLYDKSVKELKKMLNRKEVKAAEEFAAKSGPYHHANQHNKAGYFSDPDAIHRELMEKVEEKIRHKIGFHEEALYEKSLKKSVVLPVDTLKKLGSVMMQELITGAKKI